MPILKKNQLYNIFPLFTNIFTNAPGLIFCLSYAAVSSIVATYAHDSGCTSALMDRQTAATADSIDVAITPAGLAFPLVSLSFPPPFNCAGIYRAFQLHAVFYVTAAPIAYIPHPAAFPSPHGNYRPTQRPVGL